MNAIANTPALAAERRHASALFHEQADRLVREAEERREEWLRDNWPPTPEEAGIDWSMA